MLVCVCSYIIAHFSYISLQNKFNRLHVHSFTLYRCAATRAFGRKEQSTEAFLGCMSLATCILSFIFVFRQIALTSNSRHIWKYWNCYKTWKEKNAILRVKIHVLKWSKIPSRERSKEKSRKWSEDQEVIRSTHES